MGYPPEKMRTYQREWMRKRRAAFMADKECAWCGSRDRLELDHIHRETKVSHNVWSWSAERREAELAKCQVLCADCHKYKTFHIERGYSPCGTIGAYKRGCRCADCREANNDRVRRIRARRRLELSGVDAA